MVKFLEPVAIIFLVSSLSVLLPLAFNCSPMECSVGRRGAENAKLCYNATGDDGVAFEENVEPFTCPMYKFELGHGLVYVNGDGLTGGVMLILLLRYMFTAPNLDLGARAKYSHFLSGTSCGFMST